MKVRYYLLFCSFAFVADQLFSVIAPGRIWFLPLVLVILMVADSGLHEHHWIIAFCAIFADLFSGFRFGIVAIPLYSIAIAIVLLRNWIKI